MGTTSEVLETGSSCWLLPKIWPKPPELLPFEPLCCGFLILGAGVINALTVKFWTEGSRARLAASRFSPATRLWSRCAIDPLGDHPRLLQVLSVVIEMQRDRDRQARQQHRQIFHPSNLARNRPTSPTSGRTLSAYSLGRRDELG